MELNILKIASDTSHNKILNNFTHRAYKKNPMCGDYIIFKIYMKKQIIEDISSDFNDSLIGLKKLDRDSFLGVYVAFRYYKELLLKIKKANLKDLKSTRIRVSNAKKISLVINSTIKFNTGLIWWKKLS